MLRVPSAALVFLLSSTAISLAQEPTPQPAPLRLPMERNDVLASERAVAWVHLHHA